MKFVAIIEALKTTYTKLIDRLIIENVPNFGNTNSNLQERFINLIDVLYDKIKLYLSTEKEISDLGSKISLER